MLLLFNQIIKSCLKGKVISKCRQLFGSARAERATDRQRETERHKQRQTEADRQSILRQSVLRLSEKVRTSVKIQTNRESRSLAEVPHKILGAKVPDVDRVL